MNQLDYYDEDSIFYKEMFDITENRITELSRQLQTYLNNKRATIRAVCSDFGIFPNISSINSFHKWEEELKYRVWEYTSYLKNNIGSNEDLKLKFLCLVKKGKSSPKSHETTLFKNFLRNKIRLWQILHILSGLEIHRSPQLLKLVIKTLIRLCHDEKEINEIIPDFFKQIQLNYQQLDREFDRLCIRKNKEPIKLKKGKVMVKEW
ncbi:MAG: hypothetical protein ACW972_09300 [Promethearchaeota archaeon]|jgi:hypothetical protein